MSDSQFLVNRRQFLQAAGLGSAFFTTPGLFAETLIQTHSSAALEGPFYPDKMPLDTDNDLLIINGSITPAVGEITHLYGRVLSSKGKPIRNAFVEIWQVDGAGSYLHNGGRTAKWDKNFQGYGRFLTDSKGQYYFRTVKPVPYTLMGVFRAPHIHVAVSKNGKRIFTSQMLINGHKDNARDGLTRRIRDPLAKETILVDFKPLKGSKIGEVTADFEIVLGKTVQELDDGTLQGGLAKPLFGGRSR